VSARVLNRPRPARVRWGDGFPAEVDGEAMEGLRESWLVEDRWWTRAPLRRRYWELVGARGRNVVVFHDLCSGRWFRQTSHVRG
jgi:hypothetical protein